MAGQKFQYDESGGTFFYFLLSFLALILVPTTLYYWPSKKKEGEFESLLFGRVFACVCEIVVHVYMFVCVVHV